MSGKTRRKARQKNVVQKSSLQIENKKETKKEKAQILKKKRIRALFELKRTKKKKESSRNPETISLKTKGKHKKAQQYVAWFLNMDINYSFTENI